MRVDRDVGISMDDGLVLRADVFRPVADGQFPVILSYGPYAKGLPFQVGYADQWQIMTNRHPDVTERLDKQVPELGSGRPREMGSRGLRLRSRRLQGRWSFARARGPVLAARDA